MRYGHFHVTLQLPEGTDAQDMRGYINDEVRAGSGAKHPDDPIGFLNRESVRVVSLGTSKNRTYDEGSYDELSTDARRDDHRRLDQENQNFRAIINWLVRNGGLPPKALEFLTSKVTQAITEGGLLDLDMAAAIEAATSPLRTDKTTDPPTKLRP